MKRLTYQTAGDATRQSHYCAGYGVKKDDVVQRLGEYEDAGLTPEEVAELKERREEKEQADNWISCKERMPELETLVIVACYGIDIIIPQDGETLAESIERVQREHVTVTLGFIGSDGWYGCDYFPMMITPTYWQPLPDPPKGE